VSRITILADETGSSEVQSDEKIKIVRCWKLNDAMAPLRILNMIRKTMPDVVHFNMLFRQFSSNRFVNFLGLSTPALTKLLHIPVVVTLHSISEIVSFSEIGYDESIFNRLGCRLATILMLRTDIMTLTHPSFVRILQRKYGAGNVIHIPHGILREPLTKPSAGGKRFLIFGKIGPYKNPLIALEAFKELQLTDDEVELIIAGPPHPLQPDYFQSIEEKYKGTRNTKICGYIPESDLEELFRSVAAVLLPYTISTWSSGVFTLACSFGKPVIASNLPDFQELQKQGAGIMLFESGEVHDLAKIMQALLNDTQLQKRLGEANLQWASKNGFDQVANRFVEIFEDLIDGHQNAAGHQKSHLFTG
jgi:glycosyltransferase involved in cell wall biosynthesis